MLPGYDFTNGWGDLFARGLEIIEATGDHVSMVNDERNVAALARLINETLDGHCLGEKKRARPHENARSERRRREDDRARV